MRVWPALLMIVTALPAAAQQAGDALPPSSPAPMIAYRSYQPVTRGWNPAAAYITPGQDFVGYQRWVLGGRWRTAWVRQFDAFLTAEGVRNIVPTWQLLRTATM